jgi:hypothetical protein
MLTGRIHHEIEDAIEERDNICRALKLNAENFSPRYLE